MKLRSKKILWTIAVVLAAIAVGAGLYLYITLERSLPKRDGVLALEGINDFITVSFDGRGIPHIWARDEHDALFALGFVSAGDRLFQMDLSRRLAEGRLSELLGQATLPMDIQQRKIGHARMAREWLESISPENRVRLDAFVAGINAYITTCSGLPFEYHLLRVDCEKWTTQDCLAFLIFQTWFANALQSRDEFFVRLTEKVGPELAASLCLPYPNWAPTTVPPSDTPLTMSESDTNTTTRSTHTVAASAHRATSDISSEKSSSIFGEAIAEWLFADGALPFTLTGASNGWLVAPSKSSSGGAMLASDPHLDITRLPQFWYIAALHISDENRSVIGITSPGLPFVVMGHNGTAAWCFTAAGIDLADYYEEKTNPDNSAEYLAPDGWRRFETISETVLVAGADEPTVVSVRKTRNGPIVIEGDSLTGIYSVRWAGFDRNYDSAISAAFALPRTHSFEQFRHTVTQLGALDANWLYADTSGEIGYQLGAPVAVRRKDFVNLPHPGWNDEWQWQGYYPIEQTPWSSHPTKGWLGTCNNLQDRDNINYKLEGSFAVDRILRLDSMMRVTDTVSVASSASLQNERFDSYFLRWRTEVAALLDEVGEREEAKQIREWNGTTSASSHPTAVIAEFMRQLTRAIFEDELGLDGLAGVRRVWVDLVYHGDEGGWIDDVKSDSVKETRADIALRAMRKTLDITRGKNWGDLHTLTMRHPFAVVPILSTILGLEHGPEPWSGSGGSLNASYYRDTEDDQFTSLAAPSWRFLIDMKNPDSAVMVLPAGQSGNPHSPHFYDFNGDWRAGRYWPTPLSREKALATAVSKLTLAPKRNSRADSVSVNGSTPLTR